MTSQRRAIRLAQARDLGRVARHRRRGCDRGEKKVDALILEAPFTSTVDIAAAIYPIFPVRLLMKDQFRSDERIGKVSAPLLVLHGALDRVVPIAFGEKLFSLAREPKKFVRFPRGAHEDLSDYGAVDAAREFLNACTRQIKIAGHRPGDLHH